MPVRLTRLLWVQEPSGSHHALPSCWLRGSLRAALLCSLLAAAWEPTCGLYVRAMLVFRGSDDVFVCARRIRHSLAAGSAKPPKTINRVFGAV